MFRHICRSLFLGAASFHPPLAEGISCALPHQVAKSCGGYCAKMRAGRRSTNLDSEASPLFGEVGNLVLIITNTVLGVPCYTYNGPQNTILILEAPISILLLASDSRPKSFSGFPPL